MKSNTMRSPKAKSIKLNMMNPKSVRSDFQTKELVALLKDGKRQCIHKGIRDVIDNIKPVFERTASRSSGRQKWQIPRRRLLHGLELC